MTRVQRWAAILLPFVLLARAVLFLFQIRSEPAVPARADDPPAWPPVPGEVLRFRPGLPGLEAWAADDHRHPLVAVLIAKGFQTQPPDTACLLDPGAMGRNGGQITLHAHAASGLWRADWNGGRTTRTRAEVNIPEPDPRMRAAEAAVLDGADCGGTSQLELSQDMVRALIDALSARQPAAHVPPSREGLNIHAVAPEPPP